MFYFLEEKVIMKYNVQNVYLNFSRMKSVFFWEMSKNKSQKLFQHVKRIFVTLFYSFLKNYNTSATNTLR